MIKLLTITYYYREKTSENFLCWINSRKLSEQSEIARITVFVVEVKKRIPFFYLFASSLIVLFLILSPSSPFLFSLSSSSHHSCSRSRWLPHSRLSIHLVQPLLTIRRTITFCSTTLPTSSSLYSGAILFSARESSSIIDSEIIPGKKVFAANSACQVWSVTLIRRFTRCCLTATVICCLCKLQIHYFS